MPNEDKIKSPELRGEIKSLRLYIGQLLSGKIGYRERDLRKYQKRIEKYFSRYLRGLRGYGKDHMKSFDLNKKDFIKVFGFSEDNLVNTFERNIERAFALAINSIEKHLKRPLSAPGFFGLSALAKITGRKLKVEGIDRVEGLNRMRRDGGIFKINLVDYIAVLIITAQEQWGREINKALALARRTDLVYVSPHPCWLGARAKEICNRWRGRIVSITGGTPGYPSLREATSPQLVDGKRQRLFHPHCTHTLHQLTPEELVVVQREKIKNYRDLIIRHPHLLKTES